MSNNIELGERARHETIDGEARQVVWSPEHVALHLPIAGPASRMLAYAIDAVCIFILEMGVFMLLLMSTPLVDRLAAPVRRMLAGLPKGDATKLHGGSAVLMILAFFLLVQFLVEWGYFVAWELLSGGRSLGKLCVRLRVIQDGGRPITLRESLIRNLLRMVDLLPGSYVVGLIAMVISSEGKRLGDLAAGTIVVRLDRPEKAAPLLDDVAPPEIGQFRFDRAQLARLGTTELTLLRQTLRRIEMLPPQKAQVLLAKSVDVLSARIGYEPVEPAQRKAFLLALLYAARSR